METGKWNGESFIDRRKEESSKTLEMELFDKDGIFILKFHGGPTGYEEYYANDLLQGIVNSGELCICGGTINTWPACYVPAREVKQFIEGNLI